MSVTSLLHVISACFLLLSCMLVTSLLHVFLFVCTHYFSCIYQSILFLCSRIPFPPVFPYRSSQRDHCFLNGCPSFALPFLNPFLKRIYALPLSSPFFCSVLLVAYHLIHSVDWTGQRNVLVRSFFYDGQRMIPITYDCIFSFTIPNLLFPVICISMSI
jgi:hypothetical protein